MVEDFGNISSKKREDLEETWSLSLVFCERLLGGGSRHTSHGQLCGGGSKHTFLMSE